MNANKLLQDRVLIKPIVETTTSNGLIIPGAGKERPVKGKVILVGPGTKEIIMDVKPTDTVLFGEYSGIEVVLEGEKYLIMKQDDIFMILETKETN